MVDRQAHDFDTGEAGLDIDEQGWIRAVEPIDRLSWITNEKQVVAPGSQQVDEAMLERVEILSFVDEQVPESPSQRVGKLAVVLHVANDKGEHVIEVDDAALALEEFEVPEHRGCPLDTGVWLAALATRCRGVSIGAHAACRRPVDFVDETIDTATL